MGNTRARARVVRTTREVCTHGCWSFERWRATAVAAAAATTTTAVWRRRWRQRRRRQRSSGGSGVGTSARRPPSMAWHTRSSLGPRRTVVVVVVVRNACQPAATAAALRTDDRSLFRGPPRARSLKRYRARAHACVLYVCVPVCVRVRYFLGPLLPGTFYTHSFLHSYHYIIIRYARHTRARTWI